MTLPKWPWWAWVIAIVVGGIFLAGAFSQPPAPEKSGPKVWLQSLSVVSGDRSAAQRAFSVVVPAGSAAAGTEAAARELCAGATHCQVFGFPDASAKPTAMPMTDREAQALIFAYTLNRSSGADESTWNCEVFTDAPEDRCASSG